MRWLENWGAEKAHWNTKSVSLFTLFSLGFAQFLIKPVLLSFLPARRFGFCGGVWIMEEDLLTPPPPPLSLWIHCHIVFFGCVIWWPVPLSRALTFGCVPKSGAMNSVWLWNGSRLKILLDRTNGLLGITGETPQSSHTEKCICTESTNMYATQKVQETTIIWDVVPSIFRVSIFVGCFSVSTFVNTKINQKYTEKQHETFSNVVAN